MNTSLRAANTDEEEELLYSTKKGNALALTSLLQKGVCPNIYDGKV